MKGQNYGALGSENNRPLGDVEPGQVLARGSPGDFVALKNTEPSMTAISWIFAIRCATPSTI